MIANDLKKYKRNKKIPKKYEKEILIALSKYPELKKVHISFEPVYEGNMLYETKVLLTSLFQSKRNRKYVITILETATYPESEVLFNKLTENMRIGVLGHHLFHVVQYHFGRFSLIKTALLFLIHTFRKKLERAADKGAIQHGFGKQLLEYTKYIRSIPDYLNKRPQLKTGHLQPAEIEYLLS